MLHQLHKAELTGFYFFRNDLIRFFIQHYMAHRLAWQFCLTETSFTLEQKFSDSYNTPCFRIVFSYRKEKNPVRNYHR